MASSIPIAEIIPGASVLASGEELTETSLVIPLTGLAAEGKELKLDATTAEKAEYFLAYLAEGTLENYSARAPADRPAGFEMSFLSTANPQVPDVGTLAITTRLTYQTKGKDFYAG